MGFSDTNLTKDGKRKKYISVSGGKFVFSSALVTEHKLNTFPFVKIFVDEEEMKVGFLFVKERSDDMCFTAGLKNANIRIGLETFNRYKFIRDVQSNDLSPIDRRFIPTLENTKQGKMLVISFAPVFGTSVGRDELNNIPSSASGIYRYKKDGKIVYIGKGNIRRRAQESGRVDWDFDTIEFAIVNSSDQDNDQLRWEKYWIKRYVEEYGILPLYNRNSGIDVDK